MSGHEGWFLVAAWSTPALAWGLAELSYRIQAWLVVRGGKRVARWER